jgi:putative transferase (TIGR04331 family)
MNRVLVTTALQETWPKKDEPIIFLGEWCRLYDRKRDWQRLDAIVIPYHWDDRKKLNNDYTYLNSLYEEILMELSAKLNQIHSVNHSDRYWRILIGPWLGYFLHVVFDRFFMLKKAIEENNISMCNVIKNSEFSMVPNDMIQFNKYFISDKWNDYIYGQILLNRYIDHNIEIKEIEHSGRIHNKTSQYNKKDIFKNFVKQLLNQINRLFVRDDNHFFIATHMPIKSEICLQLKMRQFPVLWHSNSLPVSQPSAGARNWNILNGITQVANNFELLVRKMIPENIPVIYLEGYADLIEKSYRLPWPKKPKSIFTSNAYLENDLFKAWAAEKIDSGIPFVIGQHGGHFGMTPFAFHEEHQIKIADKWISWGWKDPHRPNIMPVGNFKNLGTYAGYKPSGGALMVEVAFPRYSYHLYAVPIAGQYLNYLEDQKRFLSLLPIYIRRDLVLRLYSHDFDWFQEQRWQELSLDIQIDNSGNDIRKLITQSRIYISTYNATTYLESLWWNVPTIIFWNKEHWELNTEANSYFELLETVGIFHSTPESAAKKMILIWDDVENWWFDPKTQMARKIFIDNYSRSPLSPISVLASVFK